jgi:hypothetical protein
MTSHRRPELICKTPDQADLLVLSVAPGSPEPPSKITALLSEAALGEDWNRPEEDEAWSHLQRVR